MRRLRLKNQPEVSKIKKKRPFGRFFLRICRFFCIFAAETENTMKRVLFILLCVTGLCLSVRAEVYTPETVPNPKFKGQDYYVVNPDGILEPETEEALNEHISKLYENTEVEVAVVVIDQFDDDHYTDYSFAHELFNLWGIGNAEKNTGILLFLAREYRGIQIVLGDGMSAVMPPGMSGEILDNNIDYLAENNFDRGIWYIYMDIENFLMEDANRTKLMCGWVPEDTEDEDILAGYLAIGLVLMVILAYLFYRRSQTQPGQRKEEVKKQTETVRSCTGCLVFIFPIPMLFVWLYFRYVNKHTKTLPLQCKKCGHDMDLLPIEAKRRLLTKNEQFEEKIGACDYDLWMCPVCGEKESKMYKGKEFYNYDKCPTCGTIAMQTTNHTVIKQPTYYECGSQLNTMVCKCCGYKIDKTIRLPKKERASSSYSSSSSSSRSYGGSSRSSGSWGGGHSSGGGAGRRF